MTLAVRKTLMTGFALVPGEVPPGGPKSFAPRDDRLGVPVDARSDPSRRIQRQRAGHAQPEKQG